MKIKLLFNYKSMFWALRVWRSICGQTAVVEIFNNLIKINNNNNSNKNKNVYVHMYTCVAA